jgi:hypothetical protein
MNKFGTLTALAFVSTVALVGSAHAFGLGALTGSGKSDSNSSSSLTAESFIDAGKKAEALMTKSLAYMHSALASKEEIAKVEALQKKADETTDAKEKESILQEMQKTEAAAVQKAVSDKKAGDNIKKLDAEKKAKLASSSYNFMLALLKDKKLIADSKSLISSLSSNPMNLSKVGGVKDVVSSLSNQVSISSALASSLPKVFSVVGLKQGPSSEADPVKEVTTE